MTEKKAWFENIATVNTNAGPIVELAKQFRWDSGGQFRTAPNALQLAHDLLRKVARVDPGALNNLQNALVAGDDAYADGLVNDINQRLDTALNFPKVWAQDKECRLNVSPRDRDLAFTIYDRTGTQYAFDERSSGLRYFLSYYIQYLAHDVLPADRDQILIMDEPDAYLSNQGQQDLLKVFHAFAFPEMDGRRPVQVVYVTHSPFLLDKNYADRIRVVEKGAGDEGTRVVRDVSRNHYEPLRSAFGAFVAETTFIGNCNLMVEGTSDQILLAGAAQHLRLMPDVPELETLDLNQITIVPTGGADQIPYLAFVALGRDIERPSVIVLLDSDDKGSAAKDVLLNGVGLRGKRRPLLKSEQILQIGDICEGAVTTEDLVPFRLGVAAARNYLKEYCGCDAECIAKITPDALIKHHGSEPARAFEAIGKYLQSLDENLSIQKIGFARAVMALLREPETDGAPDFTKRMRVLLGKLNAMQRQAVRERTVTQVSKRVQRERERFVQDHPDCAKKEDAVVFVENVRGLLDDSLEGDEIGKQLNSIVREFTLNEDLTQLIHDYTIFKERLTGIQYAPLLAVQERDVVTTSGPAPRRTLPGSTAPRGVVA